MDGETTINVFFALLAISFGAWAGVVAWIGHGIRNDLKEIGKELKTESEKLNAYIVHTESRLAVLENK